MKKQRLFTLNGKTYGSMMAIAKELGKNRIYPKDFDKYGIVEVFDKEEGTTVVNEEPTDDVVVVDSEESKVAEEMIDNVEESNEEDVQEFDGDELEQESNSEDEGESEEATNEESGGDSASKTVEEVIKSVSDLTVIQFNDIISHWSVENLEELAKIAGVNTWENIENRPIRKMRLLMEIKKFYYPNDKTPVKPASIWKKVELSDLIELAKKFNLEYREVANIQIQRMWVIKALTDAGVTYEDYKSTAQPETTNSEEVTTAQEETC